MSDEISVLDHRFGLRDKKIEALEKKFEEHLEDDSEEIRNELARQVELIAELKEEVKILGNVEDGQWSEMYNIRKVLWELFQKIIDAINKDTGMGILALELEKILLEKLDSNKKDPRFETKGYISLKLSRKVDLVKLDTLIHSIHRRAINNVIDFDSFVWQDFAEVLLKADGSWDKRPEFYHKYDVVKHKQAEKKEVDIANMVLKRCPYCTELFTIDANTLEIRGNLEDSGGEKTVGGIDHSNQNHDSRVNDLPTDSKLPEPNLSGLKCPICLEKYRKDEIEFECPYCKGEVYVEELFKPKEKATEPEKEGGMPFFKINCPFCEGNSVSDVIDSIKKVDGQWECSNGHQFVVKYLGKIE